MKTPSFRRLFLGSMVLVLAVGGCYFLDIEQRKLGFLKKGKPQVMTLVTTGYCACKICCGWKRNWYGRPVVASGPQRGKPKRVGITASGSRASPGTLAGDTSVFPFGTIMHIPGYGNGKVEDRGSGIKGMHVDLYFRTHKQAMAWGRQKKRVKVWGRR